jgi:hypothetical protein
MGRQQGIFFQVFPFFFFMYSPFNGKPLPEKAPAFKDTFAAS